MVIPRSRSALSLSKTQAYLKEPLPSSAASCPVCQQYGDVERRELRGARRDQGSGQIAGQAGPCPKKKFVICAFCVPLPHQIREG